MSGIGSFSQEAYEQLRAAYASELLRADDQENAGVTIGKDSMGVETAAINSMWLDKTGLWKYPDGKGEYQDVEQKQQDLLAVLRNDAGEVVIPSGIDDEEELDALIDEVLEEIDEDETDDDEFDNLTDDEFDQLIDQILTEIDEDETDDDEFDNLTDDEFDQLIDQILTEIEEEDEEDTDETAIEEPSAEDISARIQELKAELQALTEGQEDEDEDEEEEDIEEPEETEGEEEETESD
jgi:hypothetical protein